MPTKTAQSRALTQDRERERVVREAVRAAQGYQRRLRASAIRAYKQGADPLNSIRVESAALAPIIQRAMVAGHMQGVLRSTVNAKQAGGLALDRSLSEAIDFLRKRLGLSVSDMADIQRRYGLNAVTATADMSAVLEEKVGKALIKSLETNVSTAGGVENIRKAFDAAGVTAENDYQIEQIFRTQTNMAYTAGKVVANQDPAIDEILWGYEYVTVGDDRVRPNHAALDGVRLPKGDPRWKTIMPPCGYNCRCTVIEIYQGDSEADAYFPDGPVDVDGIEALPIPDQGWDFNPGLVFTTSYPDGRTVPTFA